MRGSPDPAHTTDRRSPDPALPLCEGHKRPTESLPTTQSFPTNGAMQMRARKKFQQILDTLSLKQLFHRHFNNMPLPRKLTSMNILINGSQVNNKQTASCRQLSPTRSQFPFYAQRKDRTHVVIPTQASSKSELRAARRLVNLAT